MDQKSRLILVLVFGSIFLFGCKNSVITPLSELVTITPSAHIAAAVYPATLSAINSAGTATLAITFTGAESTTLMAETGSSAAAPTGLAISTTGNASCSTVDLLTPTTSGASVSVSGCTGDGTIVINVISNVVTSEDGITNAASSTEAVLVQNTLPTATLVVTHEFVGTLNAENVVTATFNSLVKDLDPANANSEFLVTGCTTTQPSVATAMSLVGGVSVATATLSAGDCADGDTVVVELQRDQVTDTAGNVGAAGSNPSDTYMVDDTAPVANLAAASYPPGQTAVKTGDAAATLALTWTNAAAQTLVAGTYTTAAPPTGITIGGSGADCDLDILNPTTAGATLSLENCTGNGSLTIEVDAGVATSSASLQNAVSTQRSVLVINNVPTASMAVTNPNTTGDGANTITVTFSTFVKDLSSNNSGGEFVVSGCATTNPSVVIVTNHVGNHTEATVTLSGGVCDPTDTVSVGIHLENVTNLAGVSGDPAGNHAVTYTTSL